MTTTEVSSSSKGPKFGDHVHLEAVAPAHLLTIARKVKDGAVPRKIPNTPDISVLMTKVQVDPFSLDDSPKEQEPQESRKRSKTEPAPIAVPASILSILKATPKSG